MAKRPRLSNHLRLAEPPRPADAEAVGPTPEPLPARIPPPAGRDDLGTILSDAMAETAQLAWRGWEHVLDIQLRLARYWLERGS